MADDKVILFEPFPKQREFQEAAFDFIPIEENGKVRYRNRYTCILFGGSVRGGKSYVSLSTLILFCILFPESKWAVVRESVEVMKVTTIPTFRQLFPEESLKQRPNMSNNWTAKFHNGSEIIFWSEGYSADKELNRWRGLEVNGFLLEECNELQYVSFMKALERKGSWKMNQTWNAGASLPSVYPSIVLMTCNPSHGWVKSTFHDPFKSGKLQKEFKYIPATVYDNRAVSLDWIEEKRRVLTPFMFQRFMEGDWDITENDSPFITEFRHEWHLFPDSTVPIYDNEKITISFDFNIEPPTALIAQRGRGFCHIFDEIDIAKGSTWDVAQWVKLKYQYWVDRGMVEITGDSTGTARDKGDKDLRNQYQIICQELNLNMDWAMRIHTNPQINNVHSPKGNRAVCNAVFRLFPDFQLRIDRRCKKLVADIQNATVDGNGNLIKHRKDSRFFLDSLDAFRYLMNTWYEDIIDYPDRYTVKK